MVKKQSKTTRGNGAEVGQAQRVGLFGASGCGKSTKSRELIKGLNRVIYFEPMADDARRLEKDGFKICCGLEALRAELRKKWQTGFKLVLFPQMNKEELSLSMLSHELMQLQAGYGMTHNAQITLVVDELDLSFPSGITQRIPGNGFKNLVCRGRHTGVNVLGISQRMHLVDNSFRGNMSAVYLYRHAEPADIDTGLKLIGREYRQTFKDLENFQYIYKSGSKIFVKK